MRISRKPNDWLGSGRNEEECRQTLIITHTIANYETLLSKIRDKFGGICPDNIVLLRYFQFLYRFCYSPFLADDVRAKGIIYKKPPMTRARDNDIRFYMNESRFLFSNGLSLLLEFKNVIEDIQNRIVKYFDEFIVDEVQDIAGRDFDFLEKLMETDVDHLYVGDFYQHTYDTSRDGNVNRNLFDDKSKYEKRFKDKGFQCDCISMVNSWRCTPTVCQFITENLGIEIHSNRSADDSTVLLISDPVRIRQIAGDCSIVKLHYKEGACFGDNHYNWGESKGEDHHNDVCVYLNKSTASAYHKGKLSELRPQTRNKLYVAITRARGNVYLVNEKELRE
ncbi:MAG: hypothetical protein Q4G03_04280 [Planctomycetia bacterium]|nr:hypothetical protein [Planctomycetia bacterium]